MWAHKNWLYLLLGLTAIAFASSQASIHARLVGGVTTTADRIPYMVNLLRDNTPLCGGAILSSKWVLTAGHCLLKYRTTPSRYKIRAGTPYLTGNQGVTRNVLKITIHPELSTKTANNDIAVIMVDPIPLNGKTMKAIAICSKALPSGVPVTVSGWGFTKEYGSRSTQLRSIAPKTLSLEACQKLFSKTNHKVSELMVCTANQGTGICSGDSGSPLVYKNEVCGTVSWSLGCGETQNPSVYVNVFKFRSFITQAMSAK